MDPSDSIKVDGSIESADRVSRAIVMVVIEVIQTLVGMGHRRSNITIDPLDGLPSVKLYGEVVYRVVFDEPTLSITGHWVKEVKGPTRWQRFKDLFARDA